MSEPSVILYIEDNRENQRLVRRVLEAHQYTVLLAEDGPLGLALARETSPALILVDINIPGLDGYETTMRLRSMPHLASVPIVALTGSTAPDGRDRSLIAGCDGFLLKPVDVRVLPTQVAEFIAGKREWLPVELEARLLRQQNHKLVERLEQQVRQLREANSRLQELDQLKSQFLATISHELRTPLTAIKGYVDLLEMGAVDALTLRQQEVVGVVGRNVDVLTRLLSSLLYLQEVRSSALRLAPLQLGALVERLGRHFALLANAVGAQLHVQQPDAARPLLGDAAALEQALRHLLENAVRYTRHGGTVQVTLREDATRAVLVVQDDGVGIEPALLDKVFLPFYRVDDSLTERHSGAGVGLAIVKHIVEAHGGQITARSQPGIGSTFTIVLPRNHET